MADDALQEAVIESGLDARRARKEREVRGRIVLSLRPWYRNAVEELAEKEGVPVASFCRRLVVEALTARGFKPHIAQAKWKEEEKRKELEYLRRKTAQLEADLAAQQ